MYATKLGLKHTDNVSECGGNIDVLFRTSISSDEREEILQHATALLYTPDHEHFGIVPIEAMNDGTPVIAVNSGGPKETILHGMTGFLCSQQAESFSAAMLTTMIPVSIICNPSNQSNTSSSKHVCTSNEVNEVMISNPTSQVATVSPITHIVPLSYLLGLQGQKHTQVYDYVLISNHIFYYYFTASI